MLAVVTAADVRAAIEQTLKTWLPWTLAEVCDHHGADRDFLPPPDEDAYYQLHDVTELGNVAPQRLRIAIVVPDATFTGVGRDQRADWDCVVNLVSSGSDHTDTVLRADLYRSAIRTVLHQHQDLGGLASVTAVTRDSYRPLAVTSRLLLSSIVEATVTTDAATPLEGAPHTPPDDPYGPPPDLPETTEIIVTVDPHRGSPPSDDPDDQPDDEES